MTSMLASPAELQGQELAEYFAYGKNHEIKYINGYVTRLWELYLRKTGLSEEECKKLGLDFDRVFLISSDKDSFMPNSNSIFLKLFFEKSSEKILGIQVVGFDNVDKYIDIITSIIGLKGTLKDLYNLPLAYNPLIGTPESPLNTAAKMGMELLEGRLKHIRIKDFKEKLEDSPIIIDVREVSEFKKGHIRGAKNIPLGELIKRQDEIPKDETVYMTCRTSTRSYYAIQMLRKYGFKNLVNIEGSFLGISLIDYFNDQIGKEETILNIFDENLML